MAEDEPKPDRVAHDAAWLEKASGGDPVVKKYLRQRMGDFLDHTWADREGAVTRVVEQAELVKRYPGSQPTRDEQREVVTELEASSGLTIWREPKLRDSEALGRLLTGVEEAKRGDTIPLIGVTTEERRGALSDEEILAHLGLGPVPSDDHAAAIEAYLAWEAVGGVVEPVDVDALFEQIEREKRGRDNNA